MYKVNQKIYVVRYKTIEEGIVTKVDSYGNPRMFYLDSIGEQRYYPENYKMFPTLEEAQQFKVKEKSIKEITNRKSKYSIGDYVYIKRRNKEYDIYRKCITAVTIMKNGDFLYSFDYGDDFFEEKEIYSSLEECIQSYKVIRLAKTFEDAKVGQRVYNVCHKWGTIIKINPKAERPLLIEHDVYKGDYYMTEEYTYRGISRCGERRTLFWEKRADYENGKDPFIVEKERTVNTFKTMFKL